MKERKPSVISPDGTAPIAGAVRQNFVDSEGRWSGWADWVFNDAGDVSDWHYHPSCETYVYVLRGSLTIHFGPSGRESVVARAGDFLQIPSGIVHQEVTGGESDLAVFVLRIGCEPEQVTVDGPS